jgi:signal transduction histidine kinase
VRRLPFAVGAIAGLVLVAELVRPTYVVNQGARGAIEATIVVTALVSASLLWARFNRTQRLGDLLLLWALIAAAVLDFVFRALPAMSGKSISTLDSAVGPYVLFNAVIAGAFMGAAVVPRAKTVARPHRALVLAIAAGVVAVAAIALDSAMVDAQPGAGAARATGIGAATAHPVSLLASLLCAGVLLIAATCFWRNGSKTRESALLATAATALAAVRLQYLALPMVGVSWVTPGDGLRLGAYGLLCATMAGRLKQARRHAAVAAMTAERERIARDLHDGLAQDLAFIATHVQGSSSQLGADHPVSVAARRALASTRATLTDLSASNAPSTEAALAQVAGELEARFDVEVEIDVEPGGVEPGLRDREDLMRIAREAIINAARHGGARHIFVALEADEGHLHLRVIDDGCGIHEHMKRAGRGEGFGTRAMRARAASLGGEVVTRRAAAGGTELELLTP